MTNVPLNHVMRLERRLVVIDLETTGTNHRTSGICSIGYQTYTPGFMGVHEQYSLINPLMAIPPDATEIHGITNEMVKDAPTFAKLVDILEADLTGCDFAGYNVWFDLRQLAEEFARAGRRDWSYEGARIVDGYRLWQVDEPRTLGDYARKHGVKHDQAHNAMADVRTSAQAIANHLSGSSKLPRTVAELHALCNPGMFDAAGKLRWVGPRLCLTFGEHRDRPLTSVPPSYLRWMLGRDFSSTVKDACLKALRGISLERMNEPTQPTLIHDQREAETDPE